MKETVREGKEGRTGNNVRKEKGNRARGSRKWKLNANTKKNPKKMVLLPSSGDKGL